MPNHGTEPLPSQQPPYNRPDQDGSIQKESPFVIKAEYFAVAGVYLYFAGWAYISFYHSTLGISPLALPVPVYSVLSYSFNTLFYDAINVTLVTATALTWVVLYRWVIASRRISSNIYLPLVGIMLFPYLFELGSSTGVRVATRRLSGDEPLPVVKIQMKTPRPMEADSSEFWRANDTSMLWLLVQTEDRYYLVDGNTLGQKGRRRIYEIRKAEVFSAEILLP